MGEQLFPGKAVEDVSTVFDGRDPSPLPDDELPSRFIQLTIQDFKALAKEVQKKEPDVSHWTFGRRVSVFATARSKCRPLTAFIVCSVTRRRTSSTMRDLRVSL